MFNEGRIGHSKPNADELQRNIYTEVKALFSQIEDSENMQQVRRIYQYVTHATVANKVRNNNGDSYGKMRNGLWVETLRGAFDKAGVDIMAKINLPCDEFDRWKQDHLTQVDQSYGTEGAQIRAHTDRIAERVWQDVAAAYTQAYGRATPNVDNIARTAILSSAYRATGVNNRTQIASSADIMTRVNPTIRRH
ncbi:hypothetical protein ACWD3J_45145 [Streptomyces sp. NPDC002755]|uniref:hypothetical protein n=1 Tax=Streptomyces sp. NPDC002884 TaxID=3154544 RepID=UPI00332C5BAA